MGLMSNMFILFGIIFSLSAVSAEDFIVGDDKGWTINFDYSVWAQGKDFRVGDRLVFRYPPGVHNVFKVNGTGFQGCIKPPLSEALTSGNDMIVLATAGRKWYICGVGQHCALGGQKLVINVNPSELPIIPPSVSPPQAMPEFPIVAPYISPSQVMRELPMVPPSVSPSQVIPYTSSSYGITISAFQIMMVMLIAFVSFFGV